MPTRMRVLLALLLVVLLTAAFQVVTPTPTPPDPNANLSWPPPVYVLRGPTEIRGTANLPEMVTYFLEFRALNDDLSQKGDEEPWTPATLPAQVPIIDNILGVWDTTQVPDGLYELRLVALTATSRVLAPVRPLRIENQPPPFAGGLLPQPGPVETAEAAPPSAGTAQATARTNANVRLGDSTSYPIVTSLQGGQSVPVIAVSSTGSGWWLIRLPDGRQGFVAPSTVDVTGSTAGLPAVAPPPVPATPIPPTATGPSLPDVTILGVRFDRTIKQGEAFQVIVTVRNLSGVGIGDFSVACNFTPQNQLFSTTQPGLGGSGQIDVAITARLDSGGGANTTANCAVDVNNVVAEANDGNNYFNLTSPLAPP